MKERAYNLMKRWCDTLITYKVKTNTPYTDGALLCPACHVIHGRIADLCFPLTVIWDRTADEKYLMEADSLIDWTEYNLKSSSGIWYNDAGNRWIGTSAFAAMSIGDAIYHFGDKLPSRYKEKWFSIYVRIMDAITHWEENGFHPVSNYYCGIAASLALAWRITGNETYYDKSKFWLNNALSRFDQDGLLYGEGYPMEAEDGSHTIDMGYNLEESIPLLLRYSELTGEHREFFRQRLHDHLEFLLPDGAIDNSFGTRHNKWTYWGSRTSDGIISGLALVTDDTVFLNACERVLTLYEKCTHDGLLAMPMADEAGEPTCIHHTFTHAKALAALVCAKNVPEVRMTSIPCEENYGIKSYQNGKLLLVSNGEFRATFSAIHAMLLDSYASNGGGSMNLLYHKSYGVICAATSAEYKPSEPLNQQYLRNADRTPCMTAQFVIDGEMACKDKSVNLTYNGMKITSSAEKWRADYAINSKSVTINLTSENGVYNLPIVCKKSSTVILSSDKKMLLIDSKLRINSSSPMTVDTSVRVFNQVGGLMYLPIGIEIVGTEEISIEVL